MAYNQTLVFSSIESKNPINTSLYTNYYYYDEDDENAYFNVCSKNQKRSLVYY